MSEKTKIEWCDSTVNYISGCTKVSLGCDNCFAEALSKRGLGNIGKWGPGAPRQLHESAFKAIEKLNRKPWVCDHCGKPFNDHRDLGGNNHCIHEGKQPSAHRRRVFSLSLGDWLDPEVPIEWRARMLDAILKADECHHILCTKRPENWRKLMEDVVKFTLVDMYQNWQLVHDAVETWLDGYALINICLLTSVENQEMADKRISELLKIPARWRGLSMEPLLGTVDFSEVPVGMCGPLRKVEPNIFWIIIGGESGRNARPCNVDWIRSIVKQAKAAGVATFVKQLGANPEVRNDDDDERWPGATVPIAESYEVRYQGESAPLDLGNKKGADPAEWPEELRVQQWPEGF